MNRQEEILHQKISEAWTNTHLGFMPNHWELQRLICQWNNAESSKGGAKMVTMGIKKGVADWQWMRDNGISCWIELKTDIGVQSKEQMQFERLCIALGHEYHICRSYLDFWNICGIVPPLQEHELKTK